MQHTGDDAIWECISLVSGSAALNPRLLRTAQLGWKMFVLTVCELTLISRGILNAPLLSLL